MSKLPKPRVRLDFVNFVNLNKQDNWFTRLLGREYRIEINTQPDLLIFQDNGHLQRLYSCRKLFWTGESLRAPWHETDYAMTLRYDPHPRHLRRRRRDIGVCFP